MILEGSHKIKEDIPRRGDFPDGGLVTGVRTIMK